jgi:glycosyltransferase involved in cell wall biosynthesis
MRQPLVTEPLVSIGIPTYNRANKLARAAGSVLAQTHHNVELVISDNASVDDTKALCHRLCEQDSRVRYLRSPINRGPTANFNILFEEMRGDYTMVLSDDDWLDDDYIANCLAELRRRPELVLVCGIAHYLSDDLAVKEGVEMQLDDDSPARRVLAYLRNVDENGVFYGLMPQAVLRHAAPLRNMLGNDWLLAAAVIAQGKVAMIHTTAINRELGGTSADFSKLTRTLGLPHWQARIPHLVIAGEVLKDTGWRSPVYRDLPVLARVRLALTAPVAAIRWRSLAWHMTMPTFAAIGQRRGGRWLWNAYLSFTRRMGARHSD